MTLSRHASVIGLHAELIEKYKKLHADVWPEVLNQIKKSNIQNYSIYLRQLPDGEYYLFSYFEYTGDNFEADMAAMADDPVTQKWWDVCKPCQKPLPNANNDGWWSPMEEVFHTP